LHQHTFWHGLKSLRLNKKFTQKIPAAPFFTIKPHRAQFPAQFFPKWGSFDAPGIAPNEGKRNANGERFMHFCGPEGSASRNGGP
jgi:hypothetical protein